MQKVWSVIKGVIVTGASIGIVLLAVNQALTPKPVIVKELKQVQDDDSANTVGPVKRESRKTHTFEIPIPDGPISGITQNVVINGRRIVSASVTVEQ